MVETLVELLKSTPTALAFATFGSTATGTAEMWSDIDGVLVVQNEALPAFFTDLAWLRPLGDVLATERYDNQTTKLLRVCFTNFQRLDLLLVTEQNLRQMDSWSAPPPWQQLTIHFARTPGLQTILAKPQPGPTFTAPTKAAFDQLVNQFWFKTAIALEKIVRDDRLIAAHLVLDLIRDCAVLGMMVRDRATGTNQHRHGGIGNAVADQLPVVSAPYTATTLINAIHASGILFDELAQQWTTEYEPRANTLAIRTKEVGSRMRCSSGHED